MLESGVFDVAGQVKAFAFTGSHPEEESHTPSLPPPPLPVSMTDEGLLEHKAKRGKYEVYDDEDEMAIDSMKERRVHVIESDHHGMGGTTPDMPPPPPEDSSVPMDVTEEQEDMDEAIKVAEETSGANNKAAEEEDEYEDLY
jgi:hypothetical protein